MTINLSQMEGYYGIPTLELPDYGLAEYQNYSQKSADMLDSNAVFVNLLAVVKAEQIRLPYMSADDDLYHGVSFRWKNDIGHQYWISPALNWCGLGSPTDDGQEPLANIVIDFSQFEDSDDDYIIRFDVVCDENPFVKFGRDSITEQGSCLNPLIDSQGLPDPDFWDTGLLRIKISNSKLAKVVHHGYIIYREIDLNCKF